MADTLERIDRATRILSGDQRNRAGARCIIRAAFRAAERGGERAAIVKRATAMSVSELAAWALSNPAPVLERCAAAMERAADLWVEGNNSGDPVKLRSCERACDHKREDAQTVLVALWGITTDFPGLMPTYHRDGRTEYEGAGIYRLLTPEEYEGGSGIRSDRETIESVEDGRCPDCSELLTVETHGRCGDETVCEDCGAIVTAVAPVVGVIVTPGD